jgi:hypothetical protein
MTLEQMQAIAADLQPRVGDVEQRVETLEQLTPEVQSLGHRLTELENAPQDSISVPNSYFINTRGETELTEKPAPLSLLGFFNAEATELQVESEPGSKAAEAFPNTAITDDFLGPEGKPGTITTGGVTRNDTEYEMGEFGGVEIAGHMSAGSFPASPQKPAFADYYLIKATPGAKLSIEPLEVRGVPWKNLVGNTEFVIGAWDPVKNENIGAVGFSEQRRNTILTVPAGGQFLLIVEPLGKFEGKALPEQETSYRALISMTLGAGTFTKVLLPEKNFFVCRLSLTLKTEANVAASAAVVLRVPNVQMTVGGVERTVEDREIYSISRAAAVANTLTVACRLDVFIDEQKEPRFLEVAVVKEAGLPGSATKYAWEKFKLQVQSIGNGVTAGIP